MGAVACRADNLRLSLPASLSYGINGDYSSPVYVILGIGYFYCHVTALSYLERSPGVALLYWSGTFNRDVAVLVGTLVPLLRS